MKKWKELLEDNRFSPIAKGIRWHQSFGGSDSHSRPLLGEDGQRYKIYDELIEKSNVSEWKEFTRVYGWSIVCAIVIAASTAGEIALLFAEKQNLVYMLPVFAIGYYFLLSGIYSYPSSKDRLEYMENRKTRQEFLQSVLDAHELSHFSVKELKFAVRGEIAQSEKESSENEQQRIDSSRKRLQDLMIVHTPDEIIDLTDDGELQERE